MATRAIIQVLGAFRVKDDGGSLMPVPQAQLRIVLSGLALAGDRGMSFDGLLSAIWDDQPPRSARKTLHGYVARLRRLLGPTSIMTLQGRYRLNLQHFELDADQARSFLDAGRHSRSPRERLQHLECALGLFRGEPLQDVPSTLLHDTYVASLREIETLALENWASEQIRIDPPKTISRLREASARQPHRESLWALLIEALAASDRRAEALESYQRARSILITDLGIEPGLGLRQAQHHALTASPSRPRQTYEGPDRDIDQMVDWVQRHRVRGAAIAIAGPPGIGKTRTAADVAVAISRACAAGAPVTISTISQDGGDASLPAIAARALRDWSLGPVDDPPGELIDAWSRRMATIVLDDVVCVSQYEWLLPVPPHCGLVICTTMPRYAISDLDVFELSPYALSDVLELLGRAVPAPGLPVAGHVASTLDHVLEGLPAAVHSLADRMACEPELELNEVASHLLDHRRRLDELTSRSIDVRAHLRKVYDRLSYPAQRAFRFLGWLDAHSFNYTVAAAALQLPDSDVRELVAEMTRVGLVQADVSGSGGERRHRISPLCRSLAREISGYTDDLALRDAAVRRALRAWYSTAATIVGLPAGMHSWKEKSQTRPLMRSRPTPNAEEGE
jgi:DNA-binding SARP family transcriptional activator